MSTDVTFWSFIANASWMVKLVLFILLAASVISWTIIFQRHALFKKVSHSAKQFLHYFGSGIELSQLYEELTRQKTTLNGAAKICYAGLSEFKRLQQLGATPQAVMQGTEATMDTTNNKILTPLAEHLSLLATIGSTSPYIGLFGTVWGIMSSFSALGGVQQATLAMVAPGIAEALIATAIGLLTAIPAVIAYNRLTQKLDILANQYDIFQAELGAILYRQAYYHNEAMREGTTSPYAQ